jgi:hypothetical protein
VYDDTIYNFCARARFAGCSYLRHIILGLNTVYRALLRHACNKLMKKGLCRKSGRQTLGVRHGLINYKDTKTKFCHLKDFVAGVYKSL